MYKLSIRLIENSVFNRTFLEECNSVTEIKDHLMAHATFGNVLFRLTDKDDTVIKPWTETTLKDAQRWRKL